MIISPLILKPNTNQSDDDWINTLMPVGTIADEYPVLDTLAWHGGYNQVANGNDNVVRAIADGKVIYARKDFELIDYEGSKSHKACVVIEHETEIGDNVKVKYFSIYMHLRQIEIGLDKGRKIYRKQKIGLVGQHQNENKIHFEIVCDQANLTKIIGRSTAELNLGTNGRKDVVYGDIHFYLPSGTKFYKEASATNEIYTSNMALYMCLSFKNGKAYTQTYKELGQGIFQKQRTKPLLVKYKLNDKDKNEREEYEYDLYKYSKKFATATVSHSAIFELFRFGRILNVAVEPSNVSTISHWHKIPLPDNKEGFVNLNTDAIKKFSDGDFPHWVGWRLFNDDPTPDSQCNSPLLKAWLDGNKDGKSTNADLKNMLGDAEVKFRLSRTICQFPTEWSESLVETQYNWVTQKSDENPNPMTTADFTKFKKYIMDLSFWDKVSELPVKDKVWHFHPREFIRHFRKCTFLSNEEFARCIPRKTQSKGSVSFNEAINRVKNYYIFYNHFINKYSCGSFKRYAHNLTQTFIEIDLFQSLTEYGKGRTNVYGAFYGRGFHQLTWAFPNYSGYGKFKALPQHTGSYRDSRITQTSVHKNADTGESEKWFPRFDPNIIETDFNHASEASGYFWVSKSFRGTSNMNRVADCHYDEISIGFNCWLLNGGGNGYKERQEYAKYLQNILLDDELKTGEENYKYPAMGAELQRWPLNISVKLIKIGKVNYDFI
ncbi:peptidoglycan DD-metalloendopeptidase family protein [Acinetobacter guillouiae]|uniref:peptidoglycan DD-metalloendopeptidase family protein n=1 Tax=Acinetobacter guillouiae TaxID=106649 RepID=UPI003D05B2D7